MGKSRQLMGKMELWKVLFWAVFIAGVSAGVSGASETKQENKGRCDLHHESCSQELHHVKVTLDVNPKPVQAMKDLTFKVTVSGKSPSSVPFLYLDLGMPGMNMGPNRVKLFPVKDGSYEGKGIIVRCPSGRRTWQATVPIPDVGVAEFVFDVVY